MSKNLDVDSIYGEVHGMDPTHCSASYGITFNSLYADWLGLGLACANWLEVQPWELRINTEYITCSHRYILNSDGRDFGNQRGQLRGTKYLYPPDMGHKQRCTLIRRHFYGAVTDTSGTSTC
ncbi:hypothetical protein B0H16DRAFT_1468932 [Mycena metata]|uniref:Uncharacterized protein n=1 Tax=Mycena metata TaxID=1033252 RepID=A0AAD7I1G2_9AGAR|nr:hypothetical protein B0H16DRAFT_1468932 [Mycena metata]